MRLAVAGDARERDVFKVVADAVGLQHIEYRIQRSGVRDDAQAVSLVFQFLERLLDARAQLAMVIGDLPQASHILGVACDFFLVQIELGQVILRPDLLRLELERVALAPLFIPADTAVDLVPEADFVAAGDHVVLLQEGRARRNVPARRPPSRNRCPPLRSRSHGCPLR